MYVNLKPKLIAKKITLSLFVHRQVQVYFKTFIAISKYFYYQNIIIEETYTQIFSYSEICNIFVKYLAALLQFSHKKKLDSIHGFLMVADQCNLLDDVPIPMKKIIFSTKYLWIMFSTHKNLVQVEYNLTIRFVQLQIGTTDF